MVGGGENLAAGFDFDGAVAVGGYCEISLRRENIQPTSSHDQVAWFCLVPAVFSVNKRRILPPLTSHDRSTAARPPLRLRPDSRRVGPVCRASTAAGSATSGYTLHCLAAGSI